MVKVYFATNRNMETKDGKVSFGDRFHAHGPQFYRVGKAKVVQSGDDFKVQSFKVKSEGEAPDQAHDRGSDRLFKEIQTEMAEGKRDLLIFLHGFANSFESAIACAGQLATAYRITRPDGSSYEPVAFAFSWPSNGAVIPPWEYASDRDDAELSGPAMARSFLRLLDFLKQSGANGELCDQRIHLVAHSMGNWALRHMVQSLRTKLGESNFRPMLDHAFLMAADADDDALEPTNKDKLGLLPQLARKVLVYHSDDDKALIISDTTKGNPDRLGYNGPKSFVHLSPRIIAIDCSWVDRTHLTHGNHQYYRLRPEVIDDVRLVLSGAKTFPDREVIEPGRRYRLLLEKEATTAEQVAVAEQAINSSAASRNLN